MREIFLPETKPALEWINGRAVQKVSPKRKHALAQTRFAAARDAWAQVTGRGMVGTEWHFYVAPPGEDRRPLVPDVAYLSYARLPYAAQLETEIPRVAPDVPIEILSPDDRPDDVAEKVRVYLAAGALAVVLVDTDAQSATVCESGQTQRFGGDDIFAHPVLPGFSMAIQYLFTPPQPK
ncbi:MAG TPA: Uma2 family endonuclease [Candidatus Eremiobacteraceae bacterium]